MDFRKPFLNFENSKKSKFLLKIKMEVILPS